MSDVDRLREAADKRQHLADEVPAGRLREYLSAEANLLRAVADRDTPGKSEEWKVAQIINAASALADTILGVGEA